jgi:uncharacterized DUF497 family protein
VGQDKRLRLNATNAKTLADEYGDEASNWVGETIQLAAVPVVFQGQQTRGIRVVNFSTRPARNNQEGSQHE